MTISAMLPPAAFPGEIIEVSDPGVFGYAWLLIAIPLVSAGLLLVLGKAANRWGHWLAVLASASSFVVGAILLFTMLGEPDGERLHNVQLFEWINAGPLSLDAGLQIDPLSLTFVLLVTFVGTLIHIYSVGYMANDPNRRKFFAFLNLFVAAMLLLVLADSFLLLFVGWEGVGLASYLLIGFWNHEMANAVAAKKAFIVNRVADLGLLVAMGLMFAGIGALDFATVFEKAPGLSVGYLTAIGLCLLIGAAGKSAQFPLQSWLGDAMAGPTPVSALIHAATMVTAGVYLIVRCGIIFESAPTARLVVAIVGAVTLIFGAIIGCAKDDIKKTLAASTMSQIGYMILAAGLGPIGYAFAIFHLVTHGFFKAGMFLGAGAVMHGMNEQTDMRRFGNLRTVMKVTWITFGLGWLAILGIPPFSGFWSKDKIIESAFVGTGWQPWVFGTVALIGAGITAFYMSRLFFMTFHGKARWTDDNPHPHESGPMMVWPMIILAVGSAGLGGVLAWGDGFTNWLSPVTGTVAHDEPVLPVWLIMASTLALVLVAVFLAWRQYAVTPVPEVAPVGSALTRAARSDLYQDQVNEAVFMRPGQWLTRALVFVDGQFVDGAFTGIGKLTNGLGEFLRKAQNGYVRSYGATMLAGALLLIAAVLAVRI